MHIPVLQITLICTSFLAWICLSTCGTVVFYRYRNRVKFFRPTSLFLYTSWGIGCFILLMMLLYIKIPYLLKYILILWNISISIFGSCIIFKLSPFLSMPHRFGLLFPDIIMHPLNAPITKKEKEIILDEQQERLIDEFIKSPKLYTTKVSISEMAESVKMKKADLSKFIEQKYGVNLRTLNTALRIDHAEELLADSIFDYQGINDLAERCGFESPSTFYEAFNKRHNVSPLKWKEQVLKEMEAKRNF